MHCCSNGRSSGRIPSRHPAAELATIGGAKLLRRDDIGVLEPGRAADIIAVDINQLAMAGGMHDPVAGIVLCSPGRVDYSIVNAGCW